MTVIQLYDLSDPLCASGCSSEIESYCVRAADSRGRAEQTSFWTHKPKISPVSFPTLLLLHTPQSGLCYLLFHTCGLSP